MRILFATYVKIPEYHQPDAWLHRIEGYKEIMETLAATNEVRSIEQISYEGIYQFNGVEYHFKRFPYKPRLARFFPWRQHRYMSRLQPDVVIVHGLHFALHVIQLRFKLGWKVKIIVQHHAERPGERMLKWLQWMASHFVDAYMFTAREIGLEWVRAGNIKYPAKIREVMEASSIFHPGDRIAARAKTQVRGETVFLWVAQLSDRKDPLTVVKAFLQFLRYSPGARLYMIYQAEELLQAIESLLDQDPAYRQAVILVGRIPHRDLQDWFNSADFVIAASHYEGSGVAVCEAMSCGCIPLLTDILSFRKMTGYGQCGRLYPPGDVEALLAVLLQTPAMDLQEERRKTLEQFRSQLSFEAIAKHIQEVIASV
jgi:glycosyltransferase involved in cell wall biosynthesis